MPASSDCGTAAAAPGVCARDGSALAKSVGAGVALDARVTVGAGVATGRPFAVVGAGVTAAGPSATLLPVATTLLEATLVEATLVVESTTAVLEPATTVDGMLTGTGMKCGTSTGTGIAIFLTFFTFLTWWWWPFLPSSAFSSTVGISALIRKPRSAGAFGALSAAMKAPSAMIVAKVVADFMVNRKSGV